MSNFRRELLSLSLIACTAFASAVASADPASLPQGQMVQTLVQNIDTQVFQVEAPTTLGAPYQVLSTFDGRVYTVGASNTALIEKLQALSQHRTPTHLSIFNNEIIDATELSSEDAGSYSDPVSDIPTIELAAQSGNTATPAPIAEFAARQNYQPTILHTMGEAHNLFKSLRPLSHTSQCHERAMVWTHDMFANSGIRSMKVMMFYTQRFRNEFLHKNTGIFTDTFEPYKWWYHTAPVVYVGNEPVVLDPEFAEHEMTLDEWSHYFLNDEMFPNEHARNNIKYVPYSNVSNLHLTQEQSHCQIISNFREYAVPRLRNVGPGTGDLAPFQDWERTVTGDPFCMMRIYPMYYMQPVNVAQMDCDHVQDANYSRGLTREGKFRPALGAAVFERLNDGRYKYACSHVTLSDFVQTDLDLAYQNATQRDPDPSTGR